MTVAKPRAQEVADLGQFTGTEQWYEYGLNKSYTYTDGIRHVARSCEAYWLLDVIFSHAMHLKGNPELDTEFLVFKLEVKEDNSAVFTCEDGNDNEFKEARQVIPYTDFPAKTFKCWFVNNVLLLPSEY